MGKLAFSPFGAVAGAAAGFVSGKVFNAVWGAIDDQDPPQSQHRRVNVGKLALSLAIQGAVVSLVQGLADHGSRRSFHQLTGSWPGEEEPEQKKA